jgi:hypothetical protein
MRSSSIKPFLVLITISLITAFVITTNSIGADCDWNSGDPHKMHWPQEPDLSSAGVDISMYIVKLADDFKCSSTGPINDIHIWGSFINDTLPPNGPDSLTFEISIYSDIPAEGNNFSKPGNLLWTREFQPGEYTVAKVYDGPEDWYDPPRSRYYPDNHNQAYQYDFCIDSNPFIQQEGTIYWLVIDELGPEFPDYKFGWKTTTRDLQWNDNAVYKIDGYLQWNEMTYPDEHEYKGDIIDLAFVITGGEDSQHLYDWGDAPDAAAAAGYPTLSFNNGANHIIDGPWLGNDDGFPDAELNGQPEQDALGDDLDIEPLFSIGPPNDDEDGVSIPPIYRGQPGDIIIKLNGGGGFVDAWIDFNKDKNWDSSEKICWWFLPDGTHTITFIVPDDAGLGKTYARFRISDEGSLPPWGSALSGEVEDYTVEIYENCGQCTGKEFIRGDANNDGLVDDADATLIMEYALTGAPKPACMDAADADDNGIVDLSDATFLLHYFNGGPTIPEPFPDCGPDPTNDTLTCDQYDYCPGCITDRYAKWFQLPDVTHNGIDIRVDSNDGYIRSLADDFECRLTSLLTDVHLWGSWKYDIRGVINKIHLSIHNDDPAGPLGSDPNNLYSKPEPDVLWEMDFLPKHFKETLYYTLPESGEWWWDPINDELIEGGDRNIWRIDIDIDPNMAFLQQGTIDNPRIYWLNVRVDANDGEFGWKTRRWPDHFMDDAVWDIGSELPRIWKELRYPKGHPYEGLEKDSIDMAFCLTYTQGNTDKPTIMPATPTQCPVVATQCPTVATRCPPSSTSCPVVVTKCPPLETQCMAITTCPPTETTCPVAPTQCPVTLTECPVYETRCPPESTKCPAEATLCYVEETVCPIVETRCPPVYSQCPPVLTQCTAVDTQCPPDDTRCPVEITQCPPVDTRCPVEETQCPVVSTQCPFLETACYAITTCPPQDPTTICPAVYTQCPVISTECPSTETRCPPEETYCPVVETKCPPLETLCTPTQCPIETRCPVVYTKCPTTDTECPYIETQCPIVLTECPATVTTCSSGEICPITVYPDCSLVTITPNCQITTFPCVLGSYSSVSVRECPAVEVTCPTVISKDLLTNNI